MKTLDELFTEFGSDKSTTHANPHGYAPHYDFIFSPLRNQPIKMLEIGVGSGASIKGWLEYFHQAIIFGVDIVKDTNLWNIPWNTPGNIDHPRYSFTQGDQSDPEFWKGFITDHGSDWDVVVDDGGHYADQVITSHNCLWPNIKPGGFYCIEDLGVSYPHLWEKYGDVFVKPPWPSHVDFLKGKIDELNKGGDIDSMTFSKELCVFRKALA